MNPTPLAISRTDRPALRRFFWTLGGAIVLMFYLVLPWLFGLGRSMWPLALGVVIAGAGTAIPAMMYPVYQTWMRIAGVLGWVNSRVLLGFAFFLVVLPIGWIVRRLGKLQYDERIDSQRDSYRVERDAPPAPSDMERPF